MIKLHCQHKDAEGTRCNTCVGYVQNGVLVIPCTHGNETHTLVVTLADIEHLLRRDKERREPVLRV